MRTDAHTIREALYMIEHGEEYRPAYLSRGDLAALSTEAQRPGAMFPGTTVLSLLAEIERLAQCIEDERLRYAVASLVADRKE